MSDKKVKGKIYSVMMSAFLYSTEEGPIYNSPTAGGGRGRNVNAEVDEWSDKERNQYMRGTVKLGPIGQKIQ